MRNFLFGKKILTLKGKTGRDSIVKPKRAAMRGVNKVILIGNLGRDPDIQYLEGNIAVSKFSLATTETYKDRSGKQV